MSTITSQVLARADDLMLDAPGRVQVRRLTDISEVRILRAAREALTSAEVDALKLLRLETMERLDGSVAVEGPKVNEKKRGRLGSLLSRASGEFTGGLTGKGEFKHIAREAGVLRRLPAPADLIDAAENWAVSYLVADRLDVDVEVLRAPWLEATITSP